LTKILQQSDCLSCGVSFQNFLVTKEEALEALKIARITLAEIQNETPEKWDQNIKRLQAIAKEQLIATKKAESLNQEETDWLIIEYTKWIQENYPINKKD
jgi:hypothetical protein